MSPRHPTDDPRSPLPLSAWFLGPKSENRELWKKLLDHVFHDYTHWRRNYFPRDPVVIPASQRRANNEWNDELATRLDEILDQLKAHFPCHSPRYIAHMLSELSLPSVLGYFAGMLYNPNNVTDEAAPVTVDLELETGRLIAAMLGYDPERTWAHITSGGTVANLEALWVARTSQFLPLFVQEYCREQAIAFPVRTPSGRETDLRDLGVGALLSLEPEVTLHLQRGLARHLARETHRDPREISRELDQAYRASAFNIQERGYARVARRVGLEPVLFVSASAHYSVKKAANILGYGADAVRVVPVDSHFRMDQQALREGLTSLPEENYVAAVIAVLGTTEEGAVDPVHRVRDLLRELAREQDRTAWLHVDAAWGGYLASIFRGHGIRAQEHPPRGEEQFQQYRERIDARDRFQLDILREGRSEPRVVRIEWADPEVYGAYLAVPDADSVTIDPHKMGYIPYPAGVVAFRDGLVTDLVTQRAQYISDERPGLDDLADRARIEAVGPYILEGSKPGAAAASCWLAHKTIPLDVGGHGRIIRSTVLSARKLYRTLELHDEIFEACESEVRDRGLEAGQAFSFRPLGPPDTNLVCFVALPRRWQGDRRVPWPGLPLQRVNELNQRIHAEASIHAESSYFRLPSAQPYYISRTRFEESQYQAESLAPLLSELGIAAEEYRQQGLFVLRSTVMNPLYPLAEEAGKNYLLDYVRYLHSVCAQVMTEMGFPLPESRAADA